MCRLSFNSSFVLASQGYASLPTGFVSLRQICLAPWLIVAQPQLSETNRLNFPRCSANLAFEWGDAVPYRFTFYFIFVTVRRCRNGYACTTVLPYKTSKTTDFSRTKKRRKSVFFLSGGSARFCLEVTTLFVAQHFLRTNDRFEVL